MVGYFLLLCFNEIQLGSKGACFLYDIAVKLQLTGKKWIKL